MLIRLFVFYISFLSYGIWDDTPTNQQIRIQARGADEYVERVLADHHKNLELVKRQKFNFKRLPVCIRLLEHRQYRIRRIGEVLTKTNLVLGYYRYEAELAHYYGSAHLKYEIEHVTNQTYQCRMCGGWGICQECKGQYKEFNDKIEGWINAIFNIHSIDYCKCNYKNDCKFCRGSGDIRYELKMSYHNNNIWDRVITFRNEKDEL
jgi:hypothetical protein